MKPKNYSPPDPPTDTTKEPGQSPDGAAEDEHTPKAVVEPHSTPPVAIPAADDHDAIVNPAESSSTNVSSNNINSNPSETTMSKLTAYLLSTFIHVGKNIFGRKSKSEQRLSPGTSSASEEESGRGEASQTTDGASSMLPEKLTQLIAPVKKIRSQLSDMVHLYIYGTCSSDDTTSTTEAPSVDNSASASSSTMLGDLLDSLDAKLADPSFQMERPPSGSRLPHGPDARSKSMDEKPPDPSVRRKRPPSGRPLPHGPDARSKSMDEKPPDPSVRRKQPSSGRPLPHGPDAKSKSMDEKPRDPSVRRKLPSSGSHLIPGPDPRSRSMDEKPPDPSVQRKRPSSGSNLPHGPDARSKSMDEKPPDPSVQKKRPLSGSDLPPSPDATFTDEPLDLSRGSVKVTSPTKQRKICRDDDDGSGTGAPRAARPSTMDNQPSKMAYINISLLSSRFSSMAPEAPWYAVTMPFKKVKDKVGNILSRPAEEAEEVPRRTQFQEGPSSPGPQKSRSETMDNASELAREGDGQLENGDQKKVNDDDPPLQTDD